MRNILALLILGAAACAAPPDAVDTNAAEVVTIDPQVARPRYEPRFVLDKVLEQKQRPFDPAKPFPAVRFASETPLADFQQAVEAQWGFRPETITNAYSVAENTIYLMDDATYYGAHGRCIDDSLAHELTHYVQVVYQGWSLADDDSAEIEAVHVQRWFREQFCGATD